MFNFTDSNPMHNETVTVTPVTKHSTKTLLEQVFEALQSYGEPMTSREVIALLGPDVNDASVSSYLNQLTVVGVLKSEKPAGKPRKFSVVEGKSLTDFSASTYKSLVAGKPSKRLGRGYSKGKAKAACMPAPVPTPAPVAAPRAPSAPLLVASNSAAAPLGVRVEAQLTLHVGGHRIAVTMQEARQLFDALNEVFV